MKRLLTLALLLPTAAAAAMPKASSELKGSDGKKHTAELAFDGLLQTGWAEGDAGPGDGAWIELKLDKATPVASVSIWPGNLADGSKTLREYGRPRNVTVTLTTPGGPVTAQTVIDYGKTGEDLKPIRWDVPVEADGVTAVRVSFDQNHEGYVFNDTFVAEIALNFTKGVVPDAVDKAKKYEDTPQAKAAADKNKEQIVAWFDQIKAQEFGDSDTLDKIMDQAADGAPFMRERTKAVPHGFRVHALPPDDVAVEALLKLKDANAIPAIEMASLRVGKKEAKALAEKVEYFYAYQELIGGGNRNVPNFGEEGWEVGALRGFGEPIAIQADHFGNLYVADVGNHRVQAFDMNGKSVRQWGGEASITNRWFGGTRRYYVAGGTPGDKPGQFVNPVDVAMIPYGKAGDGFAVLDASGRVQLFDVGGQPTISWKLRTDDVIEPGVGGEGYIEYVGGKIAVIWDRQGFVYSLEAEELGTFEIAKEDNSAPNGTCALPNGKLGLIFGDNLIMYSLDGFRHGSLLGDERGEGWEDWDVTVDEDGKLWAVTDTGWVYKYKKPGKVEFKVQIADYSFEAPRLAVYDDMVFVTERNHIVKADALELKAKAELAAAESGEGGKKKKGGDSEESAEGEEL